MRFRLAVVFVASLYGWYAGGWTGVYAVFIILALIGAVLPYRMKPEQVEEIQDRQMLQIDRAKRGSSVDPTRPQAWEEHPLLLTHEIRRHK